MIYIKIRRTYEVTLPKECEINVVTNIAKPIITSLSKDIELKKDLRVLIGNNEAKLNFINSLRKQLDNLIKQLEAAIND